MKITRAFKVELDPTNEQRTALVRHCGAARRVYNWGLNYKIKAREKGEKVLSAQKLDGVLRSIMDDEFPWLREISSFARQGALANLDTAYKNFFDRCKKGKKGKAAGFPKFKNRRNGLGGFVTFGYTVKSNRIMLTRIGWVRLKESGYIPVGSYDKRRSESAENIRFFGARVTERAGRWFVSVQVEIEVPDAKPKRENIVGVDMGIKSLAVASNGLTFENHKALKKRERQLKRLSRQHSRKVKGSANRRKAARRVAVLHAKITNARKHILHHVSHVLTRKSSVLVVEDLNVAGMMKNHRLAQAIADASLGELRRQLTYKAQWRGVELVVAPRFWASSQLCHVCGVQNPKVKSLSVRSWECECGARHDRDENAAHNLKGLAASRAVSACGGESSDVPFVARETGPREAGSGLEALASVSPALSENRDTPFSTGVDGRRRV